MRVIVIGTAPQRRDLRERLDSQADIVGEFESLAAARASGVAADAWLVAPPQAVRTDDDPDRPGEPVETLTRREIEVLDLLALGLQNRTIAERLGISDQTVKFHVASITGKLGAANRTDAVRRGLRRGLITL
jgi:DNA-binding NarL/FixJ family response regulator